MNTEVGYVLFSVVASFYLPTLIILLMTLIIMLTVIPYAFSTVFKQMEAIRALESLEDTKSEEGVDMRNTPNNTEDL